jgi:hypothetical protein
MNDRLLQLFMHAWVVLTSTEKIVREFFIIILKKISTKAHFETILVVGEYVWGRGGFSALSQHVCNVYFCKTMLYLIVGFTFGVWV